MFFNINDINYFVIPDGKSPAQIFEEIFQRMTTNKISYSEKRKILASISKQLREKRTLPVD